MTRKSSLWKGSELAGSSPRSFAWGDGFRLGGGTDSGESKPPTPNSNFSSDFAHFIVEILESQKKLANIQLSLKIAISGGTSPEFRTGGRIPEFRTPFSPVATPMGQRLAMISVKQTIGKSTFPWIMLHYDVIGSIQHLPMRKWNRQSSSKCSTSYDI